MARGGRVRERGQKRAGRKETNEEVEDRKKDKVSRRRKMTVGGDDIKEEKEKENEDEEGRGLGRRSMCGAKGGNTTAEGGAAGGGVGKGLTLYQTKKYGPVQIQSICRRKTKCG